ncbi:MAG: hypothetical protein ACREA9_20550 [Pyrinomonadaceae bacterium]
MTAEERDQAIGRAFREKKVAAEEVKDAQIALTQIGMTLEKLGARLKAVNLTIELTDEEKQTLNPDRIDQVLADWKNAQRRFQVYNAQLEDR